VRLRRLRLRNYRSFRNAEFEIHDVTVFVGPNDAGKSSILDAVRCLISHLNGEREWTVADVASHQPFDTDWPELPITIEGEFTGLDAKQSEFFGRFGDGSSVWIGVRFMEAPAWEIERAGPFVVVPNDDPAIAGTIASLSWTFDGWTWLDAFTNSEALGPDFSGHLTTRMIDVLSGESENLPNLVSLPGPDRPAPSPTNLLRPFVERKVASGLQRLPDAMVYLLDDILMGARADLTKALAPLIGEYLSSASRVSIRGETMERGPLTDALVSGSGLHTTLEYWPRSIPRPPETDDEDLGDYSVPIESAGAGARRAAALAVMELYADPTLWPSNKSVIIVLEEPEAGLHPGAQRRIATSLARFRDKHGLQVILTTHSPILINAHPDGVLLVSRDDDIASRPTRVRPPDDLRQVAELLGATPADVLLAKTFLVVEGDTERAVLPIWANLMGIDVAKAGVQIIPARGWSPSGATARLLDVVYPGAEIRVLLDAGENSRAERKRIEHRFGDRIPVDLLPHDEIEAAYTREAVGRWLALNGGSKDLVEATVGGQAGPVTKKELQALAQRVPGREFQVAEDGAQIATHMREEDLQGPLQAVLVRALAE
jgi:energy-coupling factor transporter ATP-binding protein EcfA2